MKTKVCALCGKDCFYWSSKLKACKDCSLKHKANEAILKPYLPQTPINKYKTSEIKKVSTRQQKLNAVYKVIRDQFMKQHPSCQARLEGCTFVSTECHHSKGRGEYLLDDSTFKSLCHNCHSYLETHPEISRVLGFTLSRLNKY